MTLAAIQCGPVFPGIFFSPRLSCPVTPGTAIGTMDAATEKVAFMGVVMWDGAPGSAKTMGSASKIHFLTGACTFADGSTTLRIGLQDLLATGSIATPDGTFDVYADLTGGAGITGSAVNTVTLSTSGSKSVAHGQALAIVWDMTARGGADSVVITGLTSSTNLWRMPGAAPFTGGGWGGTGQYTPMVLLEADDGTFGILSGVPFISAAAITTYSDSTNPDERGLIFQVPFQCKVDGIWIQMGSGNAAADSTLSLYADPLGTPNALATASVLGEQGINSTTVTRTLFFPITEQTLSAGTDYCVALRATGASVVAISQATVTATHRSVMGLANCRLGTRNNGSGAFSETTTEIPFIAMQISALDDGIGMARANLALGVI